MSPQRSTTWVRCSCVKAIAFFPARLGRGALVPVTYNTLWEGEWLHMEGGDRREAAVSR